MSKQDHVQWWREAANAEHRIAKAVEAERDRYRDALSVAYDAMVHRPVDGEMFRLAIRDVQVALGIDPDHDTDHA